MEIKADGEGKYREVLGQEVFSKCHQRGTIHEKPEPGLSCTTYKAQPVERGGRGRNINLY